MARVALIIGDAANRITVRALLQAEGHEVVSGGADVVVTDDFVRAAACAAEGPCVVLAKAGEIRDAVAVMRQGVFGYIFVPFQPGEAGVMVQRAVDFHNMGRGTPPPGEASQTALTLDATEARVILETLRRCKHNQTRAAALLGIGRNTLWRKLKRIKRSSESNNALTEDDEHTCEFE
jgi:DNA-binding NtrC family response regulator